MWYVRPKSDYGKFLTSSTLSALLGDLGENEIYC